MAQNWIVFLNYQAFYYHYYQYIPAHIKAPFALIHIHGSHLTGHQFHRDVRDVASANVERTSLAKPGSKLSRSTWGLQEEVGGPVNTRQKQHTHSASVSAQTFTGHGSLEELTAVGASFSARVQWR